MMLNQIKILAKLELVNFFGINVVRHTKDLKEKKLKTFLGVILLILALIFAAYAGGYTYVLILLGMEEMVPAYLAAVSSITTLLFGLVKSGQVVFRRSGYDMIASLPLSQKAIVLGRFVRIYTENLLLTAIIMLPGMAVYGMFVRPPFTFYLFGVTGMLAMPLLPLSVAVAVGALIMGISSRMKNKSLVETVLSISAVVLLMVAFSSGSGELEGKLDMEKIQRLSDLFFGLLEKFYPPAIWLGTAMVKGLYSGWLLFIGTSGLFCAVVVMVVSQCFQTICRNLFGTSAKHNYQMQALSQNSLVSSLCRKELKRYFASGVYVTNTILGPVMGVVGSIAFFVMGPASLTESIPIPLDLCSVAPFALATVFCVMNSPCVSVSMEGKNWWIIKSLPLETKSVLDAKILAGLIVVFPFYAVSEIFLFLALKPELGEACWMIFVPVLCIVFDFVLGITVNLLLPVMNWEDEVRVVKQSASSIIGGLGGVIFPFICAVAMALCPQDASLILRVNLCLLLLAATVLLYTSNNRVDFRKID